MPANNSINHIDLDFETLKASLITYLRGQKQFQDYDFEGSNLSVLLDLLAYNTHKNAFYTNMVLSEAFMDSAQLRSSITSHAKELNYLPTSARSAKANVDVTFTVSEELARETFTIPKGSLFTTLVKNEAFTFTTPETITASSANTTYEFSTEIYEGFYVRDTYVFLSSDDDIQTFRITNKEVDTNSITVAVYEDGSDTPLIYTPTQSLLGISDTSKVYFLQGTGDGYYEILFGDGIFGRKPKINSTIVIEYRNSSGIAPNGATTFSLDFDPTSVGGMLTHEVTTSANSSGGAIRQSIESIRKLAPRYFAAQQRAVASDDYSSLVLANFSGVISDVAVYGGETVEPKQYGRVILALKPTSGEIAANFVKNEISTFLRKYIALPNRIIIADPDYLYLNVVTTVQYNKALTTKKASEIKSLVLNTIIDYSTDNLELFDADFRYSRFVNDIDNTDGSITSNDTTIKIVKRLTPLVNATEYYEIEFNNELHPGRYTTTEHPVFTSSTFTYRDPDDVDWSNSFLADDGLGNILLKTPINGTNTTLLTIGTIDYTLGEIAINGLKISGYTNYISLYATPLKKDVIISKNKILLLESSDVAITIIETLE